MWKYVYIFHCKTNTSDTSGLLCSVQVLTNLNYTEHAFLFSKLWILWVKLRVMSYDFKKTTT